MDVATQLHKRLFRSHFLSFKGSLKKMADSFIFSIKIFGVTVSDVGNKLTKTQIFFYFGNKVKMIWHKAIGEERYPASLFSNRIGLSKFNFFLYGQTGKLTERNTFRLQIKGSYFQKTPVVLMVCESYASFNTTIVDVITKLVVK